MSQQDGTFLSTPQQCAIVLSICDAKLSFEASYPSGQPTLRGTNGTNGVGQSILPPCLDLSDVQLVCAVLAMSAGYITRPSTLLPALTGAEIDIKRSSRVLDQRGATSSCTGDANIEVSN